MKLTKSKLKQIIKEELNKVLKENDDKVKRGLQVLVQAMQKNPELYKMSLEDVEGDHYLDGLDSWLRMVQLEAKRAKNQQIVGLADRIHTMWSGTGRTIDQQSEKEFSDYTQAGRRGQG
jgi:hypothetical protein